LTKIFIKTNVSQLCGVLMLSKVTKKLTLSKVNALNFSTLSKLRISALEVDNAFKS
jgi:hypothetical protein